MHETATFRVDDSWVKKSIDFIRVFNFHMDRLNPISCIAFQGQWNTCCLEVFEDIPAWFDGIDRYIFHHVGKTFVQPEVIPPLHGYQVTKPLVSQFVSNYKSDLLTANCSWVFIYEEIDFTVRHQAPVFHRSSWEVRKRYVKGLRNWILDAIIVFIKFDNTYSYIKRKF